MFTLHEFRMAVQSADMDIDTQQVVQRLEDCLLRYGSEWRDEGRLGILLEIQQLSQNYVLKMVQMGLRPTQFLIILELFKQSKEKMGTIKAKARWAKIRSWVLGPLLKQAKTQANLAMMQKAAQMAMGPQVKVQGQPVKSKPLLESYWREVLDPKHRMEQMTKADYDKWITKVDPDSPDYDPDYRESFFDYIDKLDTASNRTMVFYMDNEATRKMFEVAVREEMIYNASGYGVQRAFSTEGLWVNDIIKNNRDWKNWGIWVLGTDKRIFSGSARQLRMKADGTEWYIGIHHSSYYNGGAILCGGEWVVIGGELKYINCQSGHYHPSFRQFVASLLELRSQGVNMSNVLVEWYIGDLNTSYFYKAVDFLKPGVKGQWFEWPTFMGRQLRRVNYETKGYIDPDPEDAYAYVDPSKVLGGGGGHHAYGPPPRGRADSGGEGYVNVPGPEGGQGGAGHHAYGPPPRGRADSGGGHHAYDQPPRGRAGSEPLAPGALPPDGYDFKR
jgi:hypothetical protein